MATKIAKRGLRGTFAGAAEDSADVEGVFSPDGGRSVSFVIRFLAGRFRTGFVDYRFADYVFLAGPGAEIEESAALTAERELRIRVRVRWLAADWAVKFHALPRIRLTRMDLK